MRESEFWNAVDWVFPGGQGRNLAQDLVLSSLDERSPCEAIDGGGDPHEVWIAMCEAMGLPERYHYIHRLKPDERDYLA